MIILFSKGWILHNYCFTLQLVLTTIKSVPMENVFTLLKKSLLLSMMVLFFGGVAYAQDCPSSIFVSGSGSVLGFGGAPGNIGSIEYNGTTYTGTYSGSGSTMWSTDTQAPGTFPDPFTGTITITGSGGGLTGTGGMMSGTGAITCSYFSGILPLELIYFHGYAESNINVLKWATSTETNTDEFYVERSADGFSGWDKIATVDAAGWSNVQQDYTVDDLNPLTVAYYRLRMIDLDGEFVISPVIKIERQSIIGEVVMSPVPVDDILNIQFESLDESRYRLSVMSIDGKLITRNQINTQIGLNSHRVSMGTLPGGVYVITLDNEDYRLARRVIKR